jgi:hypothetical protein
MNLTFKNPKVLAGSLGALLILAFIGAITAFLIYATVKKNQKEIEKKTLSESLVIKNNSLFNAQDKSISVDEIKKLDLTNLKIEIIDTSYYDSHKYKNALVIKGFEDISVQNKDPILKFLKLALKVQFNNIEGEQNRYFVEFNNAGKMGELIIYSYDISELKTNLNLECEFVKDGTKIKGSEQDNQKLTQYVKDFHPKLIKNMEDLEKNEKQSLFNFIKVDIFGMKEKSK